jgi:hypothetical protein
MRGGARTNSPHALPPATPAYVSTRQHTPAYVSIRQLTSAYVIGAEDARTRRMHRRMDLFQRSTRWHTTDVGASYTQSFHDWRSLPGALFV